MVLKQMTLTFIPLVPIGFPDGFVAAAGSIVSGTVAERVKVFSFLVLSSFNGRYLPNTRLLDVGRRMAVGNGLFDFAGQQLSIQSAVGPH